MARWSNRMVLDDCWKWLASSGNKRTESSRYATKPALKWGDKPHQRMSLVSHHRVLTEFGLGTSLRRQDYTQAARRGLQDALWHNSINQNSSAFLKKRCRLKF